LINKVLDTLTVNEAPETIRIGVSGSPGAGKSTLIEALGTYLVELGHKVAVLAIDPTSGRSGGSILGDKTRMSELAANRGAYIRPSPAGSSLGGVGRTTGASIMLCEAAGYDTILVETVGVGQSETAVADITDLFLLLVAPAAGDDLQGIKRGVMELADLVAVTKHDGPLRPIADATASAYAGALSLIRPKYASVDVQTLVVSALENEGIIELWAALTKTHQTMRDKGLVTELRAEQAASAFWAELTARATDAHRQAAAANPDLARLVEQVSTRQRHPRSAASQFWESQS